MAIFLHGSPVDRMYVGTKRVRMVFLGEVMLWADVAGLILAPSAVAVASMADPTMVSALTAPAAVASAGATAPQFGASLPVPAAALTAAAPGPELVAVVAAASASATAGMASPAVGFTQTLAVPAGAVSATAAVPTPALVVAAPSANAIASAPPPLPTSDLLVSVPSAPAMATAPAPAVGTVVAAPSATATAAAAAPAPASTVLAVAGSASATAPAPAPASAIPAPAAAASAAATAPTLVGAAAVPSAAAFAAMPTPTLLSGLVLADDFNRSDGALGASWTTIGTAPVIATNRAQGATPSLGQTVYYAARHTTALSGDSQEVVFYPVAATAGPSAALGGGAFLRCDSSGNRVEIAITNTQVIIGTRISGTATNRATASASSPTSVRLTAIGNVYTAYLDGSSTPAVTWTDSGNLITIGSTTRYAGIVVVANTNFASQTTRGWGIDSWTAQDV